MEDTGAFASESGALVREPDERQVPVVPNQPPSSDRVPIREVLQTSASTEAGSTAGSGAVRISCRCGAEDVHGSEFARKLHGRRRGSWFQAGKRMAVGY